MYTSDVHANKWAKRLVLLVVVIALLVAVSPVGANPPEFIQYTDTGSITTTDALCDFEVEISSDLNGTLRFFTDRHGNPTRLILNIVEQDTFSANGISLVGYPFHNVQVGLYDENGDFIYLYEVGVIERVPLPDGTAFLSAGRLDFAANGFDFAITPDVGHSGDVEALCAALTP